ncbi:MAG: hypothetical protein ACK4F0_01315 [Candidatus Ratteibacteria bacterium]
MKRIGLKIRKEFLWLPILSIFLYSGQIVYSLTENEFYQFLKKKRELISSGQITMKVYHIKWKNEDEYKKFAEELKVFTKTSPEKFKEWFSKKVETLPVQPN